MPKPKPKTEEVQMVMDALSEDEIKQIKKTNPFRFKRNAGIQKLCRLGVKAAIIAEISGLSDTSIHKIAKHPKYQIEE